MKFKWIYVIKGYFNRYKIFTNQVIDVLKKERKLRNKSIRRVRVNLDTTDSVVSHLRCEMINIKDNLKIHDLAQKNLLTYVTRLESVVHDMILKYEKLESSINEYDANNVRLRILQLYVNDTIEREKALINKVEERITKMELSKQ